VSLPHRWWLYAIDTQFDDYLDAPQLKYFEAAAKKLDSGHRVILCTSTPSWVPAGSNGKTKGYDTLEFFMREFIRPKGATVPLMLTGDKHHYARYEEQGGATQRITCGLGGAYLLGTHTLPKKLSLPPAKSRVRAPAEATEYDLKVRYPDKTLSEVLAAGVFRLPWRNPGFWALTGVTQTVMSLAVLFGLAETADPTRRGAFGQLAAWAPTAIIAAVLIFGGIAFARLEVPRTSALHVFAGLAHAVGHFVLSVGWALVVRWLYHDVLPDGAAADWLILVIVVVATPLLIGFVDAEIVALYLLLVSRVGINFNEVFAAQSIEDHKGFLRLHIDSTGTLSIYPIKLARVCRRWRPDPGGPANGPWLLPEQPLEAELIEKEPIRIAHP
jgi:hypothetical protein